MHDFVLDFMPLLAVGVAKTTEFGHKERCSHTYGHVVYA